MTRPILRIQELPVAVDLSGGDSEERTFQQMAFEERSASFQLGVLQF